MYIYVSPYFWHSVLLHVRTISVWPLWVFLHTISQRTHSCSSWAEPRYLSSSTLSFMISWSSFQAALVFHVAKCLIYLGLKWLRYPCQYKVWAIPSEACAFHRTSPSARILSVSGTPALLLSVKRRNANAGFASSLLGLMPIFCRERMSNAQQQPCAQPCCRT